eukprot:TRINITY_DN40600_c0_g1_i1.p1 TRINITY_DN40600_c0_g1~~TRINITY_DN40600_c0_g1_i1.p1  ORF type:complete len:431 (-),score=80.89 TRINITY_DN40600_c0_g1_i1:7-1239(-)
MASLLATRCVRQRQASWRPHLCRHAVPLCRSLVVTQPFQHARSFASGEEAKVKAPPSPQEIQRALVELEAIGSLSRKPWLLLERYRRSLESHFDVDTGTLLLGLHGWAQVAAGGFPVVTGVANVSGNVYFACDLSIRAPHAPEVPVANLSSIKSLIANVFSHGEIGLDAVVSSETKPSEADAALLMELYTSTELRWLHSSLTKEDLQLLDSVKKDTPEKGPREVALTTDGRWEVKKRKSLNKYPKMLHLLAETSEGASTFRGDCLRHDDYLHQEVEGNDMDEWQVSFGTGAAKKAYTAAGLVPPVGCSIRNSDDKLFAGSVIGARVAPEETANKDGKVDAGLLLSRTAVSPLECAMASMAANGCRPTDIASIVWVMHEPEAAASEVLCERDRELVRQISPHASFSVERWS